MNHQQFVLSVMLIVYSTINVNARVSKKSCSLKLPSDIPKNEPLYLIQNNTHHYQLLRPRLQETPISANNHLTLACPGKKNQLKLADHLLAENQIQISCKSSTNNRFEYEQLDFHLKNINCSKSIHADLKANNEKCSNNQGNLHTVGFTLNDLSFLPIFELCYDETLASTLWSRHKINGNSIKYNVKESERRDFKNVGIPRNVDIVNAYKKSSQLEHLISVLGTSQKYFNATSFLARGHLTPDADFIFPSAQFSTYFLMNVCPQFQSINGGNWLRVESLIRRLGEHFNSDLTIYTGVHEQLKLKNLNTGNTVPLFLSGNGKIPVPQWTWKIVKNEAANSAIVFVTLNNPFANRSEIHEFCTNVCDRAYVNSKHFQNTRKGYTFCCELNEFKSIVKTLPGTLSARNLIKAENVLLD